MPVEVRLQRKRLDLAKILGIASVRMATASDEQAKEFRPSVWQQHPMSRQRKHQTRVASES
jgi:hypothetical protein